MFQRILAIAAVTAAAACQTPTDTPDQLVGTHPDPTTAPANAGGLWYRVDATPTSLEVHVRLLEPPDTTRFFLPGTWAGRSDFGQRIRIAGASGPDGPRLLTIDRNEGRVDVDATDAAWIELHYTVDVTNAPSPLHPWAHDGMLTLYGPAFLVLPAQQILDRVTRVPIELHTPHNWSVMSTWPLVTRTSSHVDAGTHVRGYLAADGHSLRDAFAAMGDSLEVREVAGDLNVGFSPAFVGDRNALMRSVASSVSTYRRTFGDLGAVQVLVTTTQSSERELGGLGRRGGFVLQLPPDGRLDDATALLVWHEALHLWNGHHAVPKAAAEAETRWFKEGVTHFVALQAACENLAVRRTFVLEEIARVAGAYERNPARFGQGEDADRTRFPYDMGALLALKLETRQAGIVSAWLTEVTRGQDERYFDAESLAASLRAVSRSRDVPKDWSQHVRQRAVLEAGDVLRDAGLHLLKGSDLTVRVVPLEGADRSGKIFGRCMNVE